MLDWGNDQHVGTGDAKPAWWIKKAYPEKHTFIMIVRVLLRVKKKAVLFPFE